MVQKYALMQTQPLTEEDDESPRPTSRVLNIITDDNGVVVELTFPPYRSSNAMAQDLFNQWRSSEGQTLQEFYSLIENYGDSTLQVVPLGVG
jgi:hypothetical protein